MLIIDGHNLIPNIPELSLRNIDDEAELISLLQIYARVRRRQVVVFFDGAQPGDAGVRNVGMIKAHFVSQTSTADEAIRKHLADLKGRARGASVVTSDRLVQAYARERGAAVIASEDFARQLRDARDQASPKKLAQTAVKGSANLDDWFEVFGIDPDEAEKPIEPPPAAKKRRGGSSGQAAAGAPKTQMGTAASKPGGKKQRHGFAPKKD